MEFKRYKKVTKLIITLIILFFFLQIIEIYMRHGKITLHDIKRGLPVFVLGLLIGGLIMNIRIMFFPDSDKKQD